MTESITSPAGLKRRLVQINVSNKVLRIINEFEAGHTAKIRQEVTLLLDWLNERRVKGQLTFLNLQTALETFEKRILEGGTAEREKKTEIEDKARKICNGCDLKKDCYERHGKNTWQTCDYVNRKLKDSETAAGAKR